MTPQISQVTPGATPIAGGPRTATSTHTPTAIEACRASSPHTLGLVGVLIRALELRVVESQRPSGRAGPSRLETPRTEVYAVGCRDAHTAATGLDPGPTLAACWADFGSSISGGVGSLADGLGHAILTVTDGFSRLADGAAPHGPRRRPDRPRADRPRPRRRPRAGGPSLTRFAVRRCGAGLLRHCEPPTADATSQE